MVFEYGSIDLGIRNPFKIEGIVRAAAAAMIVSLGLICLFGVQGAVQQGNRGTAASLAIVGVFLTGWAIRKGAAGLFQVFRFFVGRRVPADLAQNLESAQSGSEVSMDSYKPEDLEKMLKARVNTTFGEPEDWLSRLVHSVFERLLFLPRAYRNMALRLASGVAQSALAVLCYLFTWLSAYTDLTGLAETPVLDWLALFLGLYLLTVWAKVGLPLDRALNSQLIAKSGTAQITLWIAIAILAPMALSFLHSDVFPLPQIAAGLAVKLFLIFLLGVIGTVILGVLLGARCRLANPNVEVAEYRDNWQESIHPSQVFIHFETIVMANRRHAEVPNRIYRGWVPTPVEDGGSEKGEFHGETIQETQPVWRALPESMMLRSFRLAATVLAGVLSLVCALMIFFSPSLISGLVAEPGIAAALPLAYAMSNIVIVAVFARLLSNFSHYFWAEMQFESLLIYFGCRGTYTESKLSTGTGIYDSTRSENVVIRSSITPWIIASRAVSSTFATSGTRNLEQRRDVLELHRAQEDLLGVVNDLKEFTESREIMAGVSSEKDLRAIAQIYDVNQRIRAQTDRLPKPKHPPLDRERIEGAAGEDPD